MHVAAILHDGGSCQAPLNQPEPACYPDLMKTLSLIFAAAVSLTPLFAYAESHCAANPKHTSEKRCNGVYCGAYGFAKCVTEYCCTWIVESAPDEYDGDTWFVEPEFYIC